MNVLFTTAFNQYGKICDATITVAATVFFLNFICCLHFIAQTCLVVSVIFRHSLSEE